MQLVVSTRSLILLLLLPTAALAQQVTVPSTSPDGPGRDATSLLRALGITSDVTVDQVDARLFRAANPNQAVSITNLFAEAAYKDAHKFGFYQPTGVNSDPAWHLGGSSTGLPQNSKNVDVMGWFGLALQSPEGTFRSERNLNTDGVEHFAVLRLKFATNAYVDHAYVILMEDLNGGGDRDYNDRAILLKNVKAVPVPEPASLLAVTAGVALLARRRRK